MINNKWLSKEFHNLNKMFFDSKIIGVTVKFGNLTPTGASGVWRRNSRHIVICNKARATGDGSYVSIILLHEMVHAYLENDYKGYPKDGGHGTMFQGEICRLIKAGAYDGLL